MLKRFFSVSVVSVLLASIWLTPAISAIINADTVNGIGASRSARAGYLYPLNSARKFPNGVLYTGSGKGLDADKLDGRHGSTSPAAGKYLTLNGSGKFPNSVLYTGSGNGLDADKVDGKHASDFVSKSAPTFTPQARYYTVGMNNWVAKRKALASEPGVYRGVYTHAVDIGEISAPVQLPDGATIIGMHLYYYDINATQNFHVNLAVLPYGNDEGGWTNIVTLYSGGASGFGHTYASSTPRVVNNQLEQYEVWSPDTYAGKAIQAVVIVYTIAQP